MAGGMTRRYRPIDYRAVRKSVPISRILAHWAFEPTVWRGDRLRGRCLLADCRGSNRSLSIDMERSLWYCFVCRRGGDQLELWRLVRRASLYVAALELCALVGRPVPYLR